MIDNLRDIDQACADVELKFIDYHINTKKEEEEKLVWQISKACSELQLKVKEFFDNERDH